MSFGLGFEDARIARTVFYQRLREAIAASPRFEPDPSRADILIPAEDTARETNWPRFGDPASAYIRGRFSRALADEYLRRVTAQERPSCVINMDPFARLPLQLSDRGHVVVADINLRTWERAANPRTVSMPALPITTGTPDLGDKTVLASFRGAASHPSRRALERIHDGRDIVCELVARRNHAGRIDATSGRIDEAYARLLAASVFAFVPRGDAHFSYRLLEVMSFGCIPVVLSDDLVLPFDRSIAWDALALHVSEAEIPSLPEMLARFSAFRIAQMQRLVASVFEARFATMGRIVETLFDEVEIALGAPGEAAPDASLEGLVAAYRARTAGRRPSPYEVVSQAAARRLLRWLERWSR